MDDTELKEEKLLLSDFQLLNWGGVQNVNICDALTDCKERREEMKCASL